MSNETSNLQDTTISPEQTIDNRYHNYHVGVARDYSLSVSTFITYLSFWTEKNLANDHHIYDGLVWSYDKLEALLHSFSYFSMRQLRGVIDKCVKNGLVKRGNYNKSAYDRTCWYALTPKAYKYFPHLLKLASEKGLKIGSNDGNPSPNATTSICQKGQIKMSDVTNLFVENDTPIPDTSPDTIPIVCGETANIVQTTESDEANAHTQLKILKKEKAEQNAMECEEAQTLFKAKFSDRAVTIKEIFEGCKDHYEQKSLWATKDKFVKWLGREKPENYPKVSFVEIKKPSVAALFTDEELALLADYKHWMKNVSHTAPLEKWFPDEYVRIKAVELFQKEKEALENKRKV